LILEGDETETALQSGEDLLIARYFRPLARHAGAFGLEDDAAAIEPPAGCDLVLKADGIIAGVHFFPDDPPETVGRKALRVNLSDLAAKSAKPLGFLLTLALPKEVGDAWLSPFARGLGADAERFDCPLVGGDTDRTDGPITISIAAFGAVPHGGMVRRAGAQPGDRVVVTGTIGDATLGLLQRVDPDASGRWSLASEQQDHLRSRYLLPQPRMAVAELLRPHVSAAMDISDGLVGDLGKLCRASGLDAVIEAEHVPLSDAACAVLTRDSARIEAILTGGDDYEILATVPPGKLDGFRRAAARREVAITEIGAVCRGEGEVRVLDRNGAALDFARPSFSHF
jgi:thiamine-monophosphate kinase